jgi:hypothetical protein
MYVTDIWAGAVGRMRIQKEDEEIDSDYDYIPEDGGDGEVYRPANNAIWHAIEVEIRHDEFEDCANSYLCGKRTKGFTCVQPRDRQTVTCPKCLKILEKRIANNDLLGELEDD